MKRMMLEGRKTASELGAAGAHDKKATLLSLQAGKEPLDEVVQVKAPVSTVLSQVVTALKKYHEALSEPENKIKFKYSPYQRQVKMREEIKVYLMERARELKAKNMDDETIAGLCQAYVDDICRGLKEVGVDMPVFKLIERDS